MRTSRPTALAQAAALALGAAFAGSAAAQSNADLLKELQALKARVAELEAKQKSPEQKADKAQWGMTPEQSAEFNRIAVKTEALEDSRDAAGLKLLKISGYMDPTYIYNKRQHRAGFQFLNRVDDDGYNYDNSYFGAAVIDFQKETDSGTRWRLTLAPNRGVGSVIDGASIVHEASVSMPITDLQTRLIAGQIPDWTGYEYLQPTLNKLITHNLAFDFTFPTAYTGAGVEITRGKWLIKALLGNMNATRKAAKEKYPIVSYRVDYSKGEFQGFGFTGQHGKATNLRADETMAKESPIHMLEFDAYFIRGDWTLQGQVNWGRQKYAGISDPFTPNVPDAEWWGLSGLAAYKWTPRFESTARLDYLNNKRGLGLLGFNFVDDRNGIGANQRMALTLGASWMFNLNTTFKVEYRLDRASLPLFLDVKSGELSETNHLFGASMVVSF